MKSTLKISSNVCNNVCNIHSMFNSSSKSLWLKIAYCENTRLPKPPHIAFCLSLLRLLEYFGIIQILILQRYFTESWVYKYVIFQHPLQRHRLLLLLLPFLFLFIPLILFILLPLLFFFCMFVCHLEKRR